MSGTPRKKLVEVTGLRKEFPIRQNVLDVVTRKPKRAVKAVDRIDLDIYEKEILALVGESGCGKSTFARTLIRLYNPDEGRIIFDGRDITHMGRGELRPIKREMQMVFQDPYSSLNPRQLVGDIFREALTYHNICSKAELEERVLKILATVGLDKDAADRFPSEFSGGQRQRIGIARALALRPKLVVADEPVSALDVSIQAQILNLLKELQEEFSLTILFISHDLRVVQHISDRVAVMYLGTIVELGTTDHIYKHTLHPYSDVLLRSAPNLDPRICEEQPLIEGDPPSPIDVPPGCRFSRRCKRAKPVCFEKEPELTEMEPGHFCACHL